jgi:hypothetical protein
MSIPLASIPLDLYVLTETLDSSNAPTRAIPAAATKTGILCSVQPMRGYEMDLYQRRDIVVDFKIYTDYDFAANVSGGLKVGSFLKDPASGFRYQVKGVEPSANSFLRVGTLYKVLCRRFVV